MARGVNKVILIGNLGNDPKVTYMPNGNAVANITIATSESWKDKNTGEQVNKTEWHKVVFFRRLAEIVGEYLKKGSKIYIEGKLQTRDWEKDGQRHYITEIIANEMQMLDSRGQGSAPQQQSSPAQSAPQQSRLAQSAPAQAAPAPVNNDFDDDIPF